MKFKYWLTSLTDISNAKKKLLHDCSIKIGRAHV